MEIHVEGTDAVVISVAGEVDLATAPELERSLGETLGRPGVTSVRVDMSGVEFMDSAGLRVLATALGTAAENKQTFGLKDPSARVYRIIEIAGLADVFGVGAGSGDSGARSSDRPLEQP